MSQDELSEFLSEEELAQSQPMPDDAHVTPFHGPDSRSDQSTCRKENAYHPGFDAGEGAVRP